MSDTNRLRERIGGVFATALQLEVPAFDTDLFETGVLDSLAFVRLLVQLEEEFGVSTSVDDLELDNFRTIDSIAAFIAARVRPQRATVVSIAARG
jgi:D-alanine--poly(phosphoribitol) ligase subunit 2